MEALIVEIPTSLAIDDHGKGGVLASGERLKIVVIILWLLAIYAAIPVKWERKKLGHKGARKSFQFSKR